MKIQVEIIKSGTRLNGVYVEVGDIVEIDESLSNTWLQLGIAKIPSEKAPPAPKEENTADTDKLKHVGGGYYELPNGEKIKGKEAALEAFKALEGGDENGLQAENSNGADNGTGDAGGSEERSPGDDK